MSGGGSVVSKALDKTVGKALGVIDDTISTTKKGVEFVGEGTRDLSRRFSGKERRMKERAETDKQMAQEKAFNERRKIREKQEGAEKKAQKDLARGRARQQRRKKSQGRASTILTDNVGSVGGEDNQGRRNLLGL